MYLPFKPRRIAATNQRADALDNTPEWLKRNSSIDPNLTALGALAWYNVNSLTSIKEFFGVKVCKRTRKHDYINYTINEKRGRQDSREYEIWQNG